MSKYGKISRLKDLYYIPNVLRIQIVLLFTKLRYEAHDNVELHSIFANVSNQTPKKRTRKSITSLHTFVTKAEAKKQVSQRHQAYTSTFFVVAFNMTFLGGFLCFGRNFLHIEIFRPVLCTMAQSKEFSVSISHIYNFIILYFSSYIYISCKREGKQTIVIHSKYRLEQIGLEFHKHKQ